MLSRYKGTQRNSLEELWLGVNASVLQGRGCEDEVPAQGAPGSGSHDSRQQATGSLMHATSRQCRLGTHAMAWPIEPHASTSTRVKPAGSLVWMARGCTCRSHSACQQRPGPRAMHAPQRKRARGQSEQAAGKHPSCRTLGLTCTATRSSLPVAATQDNGSGEHSCWISGQPDGCRSEFTWMSLSPPSPPSPPCCCWPARSC